MKLQKYDDDGKLIDEKISNIQDIIEQFSLTSFIVNLCTENGFNIFHMLPGALCCSETLLSVSISNSSGEIKTQLTPHKKNHFFNVIPVISKATVKSKYTQASVDSKAIEITRKKVATCIKQYYLDTVKKIINEQYNPEDFNFNVYLGYSTEYNEYQFGIENPVKNYFCYTALGIAASKK